MEANSVIGTKIIMLPFTYVVMVMNTRWQMGSDKQESFSFFKINIYRDVEKSVLQ